MSDIWCFSINEEDFHGGGETKEDAILEAIATYNLELDSRVFIGQTKHFIPSICPTTILERLEEQACEECGDHAEQWLSHVSKEDTKKLGDALDAVLTKWIEETCNTPHFFSVENVEHMGVTQEMIDKLNPQPKRSE